MEGKRNIQGEVVAPVCRTKMKTPKEDANMEGTWKIQGEFIAPVCRTELTNPKRNQTWKEMEHPKRGTHTCLPHKIEDPENEPNIKGK